MPSFDAFAAKTAAKIYGAGALLKLADDLVEAQSRGIDKAIAEFEKGNVWGGLSASLKENVDGFAQSIRDIPIVGPTLANSFKIAGFVGKKAAGFALNNPWMPEPMKAALKWISGDGAAATAPDNSNALMRRARFDSFASDQGIVESRLSRLPGSRMGGGITTGDPLMQQQTGDIAELKKTLDSLARNITTGEI